MTAYSQRVPPLMGRPKLKKIPTQVAIPVVPLWKITVDLKGGEKIVGEGETCLAALQAVKKPAKIVSNALVTIEHGKEVTDRYFRPQQLNRVFYSSPKMQEIHAKQLSFGLKGVKA